MYGQVELESELEYFPKAEGRLILARVIMDVLALNEAAIDDVLLQLLGQGSYHCLQGFIIIYQPSK